MMSSSMKSGLWLILESVWILGTKLQVYTFFIFAWIFFLKYVNLFELLIEFDNSTVYTKQYNFVTDVYLHAAPDGGSKNKTINERPWVD